MSFWFPLVSKCLVSHQLPKTVLVTITDEEELSSILDGRASGVFCMLCDMIRQAGEHLGYPVFLRTGQLSGKHSWVDTCFVPCASEVDKHVFHLIEESHMASVLGLPCNVWAVREMLKTRPAFVAFNGFPVTKERRYFCRGAKVVCHHPYWPADTIRRPSSPSWVSLLKELNSESAEEVEELSRLTRAVGYCVGGSWSVDWLWTEDRGWVLIDMAVFEDSYHDLKCPNCRAS